MGYLSLHRSSHIFSCCLLLCSTLVGIYTAELSRRFIDEALINANFHQAIILQLAIIGMYFLRGSFQIVAEYILNKAATNTVHSEMLRAFRKITLFNLTFFRSNTASSITSRIINDTGFLYDLICETIPSFFVSIFSIFIISVFMFYIHPMVACIAIAFMPIYLMISNYVNSRFRYYVRNTRDAYQDFNETSVEILSSMKNVKSLQLYRSVEEREEKSMLTYSKAGFMQYFMAAAIAFGKQSLLLSPYEAIILICASYYFIVTEEISLGMVLAFVNLFSLLIPFLSSLEYWMRSLANASVSFERLDELLDNEDEVFGERSYSHQGESIVVNEVTFKYMNSEQSVLHKLSCSFNSNQLTIIKAKSGYGKSTLLDLLFGFYQPTKGEIFLGDACINNLSLIDYRSEILYFNQENLFFNDTLRYNLELFAKPWDEEQIIKLFHDLGLYEWYSKLANGFETILGERGNAMSAGQKQRLALVQAIISGKKILLFDEPTAGLDLVNEQKAVSLLEKHKQGKTIIVVTHSSCFDEVADKIIDLETLPQS